MKTWCALALALLLALPAAAETADQLAAYALTDGQTVEVDLDGDGEAETLSYRVVPDIETGEGIGVEISVADGGASATWGSDMIFRPDAYIADLDGDGATEVLVSGDWASADFVTWGLRWDGNAFQRLSFASDSRSGAGAGYTDEGYGHVFAIGDGRVSLIGAYDALGTYSATRVYALRDGVFEFADDGLWHVQVAGYAWDIPLVTTREVSATFVEDGAEVEGTLPVGARLIITASDGTSVAWFETEDGREGYLSIAPDAQRGWGSTVDGVPEDDVFKMVPYAG